MKLTPIFHSPQRLIVGDAPLVGVLDLPSCPSNHERPPIRLFFPAATTETSNKPPQRRRRVAQHAKYFIDNRVSYVLQGFAHIAIASHTTKLFRFFLRPLMWMISLLFPARFLKIPNTALVTAKDDLAIRYYPLNVNKNNGTNNNQSLVVFSHGLTGTGEENALFCTALAKRGYVVACIHHRDGSSSRVPMPDGTCKFFEHLPRGEDYSPNHRLEQVSYRAKEFLYTTKWLLGEERGGEEYDHPILQQIRPNLDSKKVIASGFSYGSTTCSLAATVEPERYQCAVFLDGWFHVDFSSRGYVYNFPPEAFGEDWPDGANNGNEKSHVVESKDGLKIPSIFINSAQFAGYKQLYGATTKLANIINDHNKDNKVIPETTMHVIPNTKHQNFCDVGFWLPKVLLHRLGKLLALGDADVYEASENILDLTMKFLKQF